MHVREQTNVYVTFWNIVYKADACLMFNIAWVADLHL